MFFIENFNSSKFHNSLKYFNAHNQFIYLFKFLNDIKFKNIQAGKIYHANNSSIEV